MGQWEVYNAVRSLGGRVTFDQIRNYMRQNHLGYSDSSIRDALKKLVRDGLVGAVSTTPGKGRWAYYISGEFPERNVVVIDPTAKTAMA